MLPGISAFLPVGMAAERSGTWTLGTWEFGLAFSWLGWVDGWLGFGLRRLGRLGFGLAPSFATTGRGFSSETDCAASTGGGESMEAALWPAALADF